MGSEYSQLIKLFIAKGIIDHQPVIDAEAYDIQGLQEVTHETLVKILSCTEEEYELVLQGFRAIVAQYQWTLEQIPKLHTFSNTVGANDEPSNS